MSDLTLTHTMLGDGTTLKITVAGRLAIDTAPELQALLLDRIGPVAGIQMDLSAVDAIDLAGLQLICSACRTALDSHKRFNFSGNMTPDIKTTIEHVGLQGQTTCKHNDGLPCIWCGGIN